jgi:hydrogenase-4 component E
LNLLIIFLLLAALLLTRVTNLKMAVNIMLIQSVMVALACMIIGLETGEMHIYIAALLTVVIKVWLIPFHV